MNLMAQRLQEIERSPRITPNLRKAKGEGSRPLPSPPSSSPRRPCRPTPTHRGGDETGLAATRKLIPHVAAPPQMGVMHNIPAAGPPKGDRLTMACRAHHARHHSPLCATHRATPPCSHKQAGGSGGNPGWGHAGPVFVAESHAIREAQWIGCFRHSFAIHRKCDSGGGPVSRPFFSRPSSCASHRGSGPPSPV